MPQTQQQLETELHTWYDKYHFFRMEKINAHDAGQKFAIQQQLKQIQSEIQRLETALAEHFAAQVDDCEIEQVDYSFPESTLGMPISLLQQRVTGSRSFPI